MGDERTTTHVDPSGGLWIPHEFREFDRQIVIRTPRATIQHFGTEELAPYYGMIDESHFGEKDKLESAQNPELAPDRIKIKPQGESTTTLTVDVGGD